MAMPTITTIHSLFTVRTMALQSLIYSSIWATTTLLVRHLGPSTKLAPVFMKYHNRIYSFASFLLLLLILHPQHDALARTVYHLSKFYEYLDILSVTAAGGSVGLHFGFHHLTTPWLTFVRVLPSPASGSEGWRWFAAANAAHHALMYAYFGGWQGVRGVLLWTGELQLVVGMVVDAMVVWRRLMSGEGVESVWRFVVSGGLLGCYFALNRREMGMRAEEEGKRGDKGGKET
ncbi:hypothetical protein N656DRAFT_768379 [Canariomyces notabilis]|uniref:Uncharacterized protein n=1 Tax=Canariomyces notabilis TaxID=2074819 RepID=A0AAN6YSH9_9PEZI|nr:hypothetical protein N656DRAFT_768379 [Canariomyces arenarius]